MIVAGESPSVDEDNLFRMQHTCTTPANMMKGTHATETNPILNEYDRDMATPVTCR